MISSFSHSCINAGVHACARAFIHSFVDSFVHAFVCSCMCSFIHAFMRSFVRPYVRSFLHSFVRSFIHSLVCLLLSRSFVRSFMRSFVHSGVHSFHLPAVRPGSSTLGRYWKRRSRTTFRSGLENPPNKERTHTHREQPKSAQEFVGKRLLPVAKTLFRRVSCKLLRKAGCETLNLYDYALDPPPSTWNVRCSKPS